MIEVETMRPRWWIAMVLAVVAGCGVADSLPAADGRAKVEFRRAERTPGQGLVEADVIGSPTKIYLHPEPDLSDEDIADASVVERDGAKGVAIEIVFTERGHRRAAEISKQHMGKPLAIVVDGKVVAAPTVKSVLERKVLITGEYTRVEADRISRSLRRR